MRRVSAWRIAAVFWAAATAAAAGQQSDGLRVYQEEIRMQFDQQAAISRQSGFDAGGWFTFSAYNFDDATRNRDRTLRQYDGRLWGKYTLDGVHSFYVRGAFIWNNWNPGDQPVGEPENPQDSLVERAWYEYDFGRAVQNQTGARPSQWFKVRVGRDYTTFGTGLVLALPLDAVQVTYNAGDVQIRGLLGQTVHDTPNIDTSFPVSDHMDRTFWGAEATYNGFSRHTPFLYFLSQNDSTDESPEQPLQDFTYDSRYIGAGSRGSVLSPDLRYQTEIVGELGESSAFGPGAGRNDICAMAFDNLLEYIWSKTCTTPKLQGEYLWATGDDDRLTSSTNTLGGNPAGSRDTAFNAFGFRDTGLAFAPAISNLHMFMAGGSFYPFQNNKFFEKMEVGTKVFVFLKAEDDGPTSDPTSNQDSRFLGWEPDVFINWRITSDLSWTIRYGIFQPSDAFDPDERDSRHFIFTGITYSF